MIGLYDKNIKDNLIKRDGTPFYEYCGLHPGESFIKELLTERGYEVRILRGLSYHGKRTHKRDCAAFSKELYISADWDSSVDINILRSSFLPFFSSPNPNTIFLYSNDTEYWIHKDELKEIHNNIKKMNIDPKKVILLTWGDITEIEDLVNDGFDLLKDIQVVAWSKFAMSIKFFYELNPKLKEELFITNDNKKKVFLNLCGSLRPWRKEFRDLLYKNGLNEHGYMSAVGAPTGELKDDEYSLDGYKVTDGSKRIREELEVYFYSGCLTLPYSDLSKFYSTTYFSVVFETIEPPGPGPDSYQTILRGDSPNHFLMSEKIFYSIANGHPFMVVGYRGILRELRELGFQTFPEIFDESYDEVWEKNIYMEKICGEIKRICDMEESKRKELFNSIKEKVEYNQNLLLHTDIGAEKLKGKLSQFNIY